MQSGCAQRPRASQNMLDRLIDRLADGPTDGPIENCTHLRAMNGSGVFGKSFQIWNSKGIKRYGIILPGNSACALVKPNCIITFNNNENTNPIKNDVGVFFNWSKVFF